MFETVLFPIDSSRESREAAEMVTKLVKTYNSRLTLLAVTDESAAGQMSSPEAVAELLKNARALFTQQEIEAETIERQGNPPFVICDVAGRTRCGSHCHGVPRNRARRSRRTGTYDRSDRWLFAVSDFGCSLGRFLLHWGKRAVSESWHFSFRLRRWLCEADRKENFVMRAKRSLENASRYFRLC